MRSLTRQCIGLLVCLLMSATSFAQATSFTANADAKQVFANSILNVEYKLTNGEGTNFTLPNFSPFKQAGGSSTQNSVSVVNGKMTRTITNSIRLLAPGPGKYTIPPATITVNGKKIKSNAVSIEVLKADKKKASATNDFRVEIIPSYENVYLGQQLILDYKLYATAEVRSFTIIDESTYDGFFATTESYRNATKREIVDGKEYYTKIMQRTIMFPQQTGTYTIGPSNIELGIVDENQKRGGFFFSTRLKPTTVRTNGITIQVRDLPTSTDPAFSNAVGKYIMSAKIDQRKITTDDAITIQVDVSGDGDAKFVTAPNFIDPDEFDIYDPNIIQDNSFVDKGKKFHRKTFEYLVVPKKPGNYSIQPKFQYFDLDSNKYLTLMAPSTRVFVTQGEGNKDAALFEQNNVVELSPIRTSTKFHTEQSGFYKSIPYWLLLGLCFMSMAVTSGLYYRRKNSGQFDPELIRKQKAQQVALDKLKTAKNFMDQGEGSKFYEELMRAVKEFIADKYSIPATYLNKDRIKTSLSEISIDQSIIDRLEQLFQKSEMSLYAGGGNRDMSSSYDESVDLIVLLNQEN